MACSCDIKKMQSELERISDLAKKAAVLDGCMLFIRKKMVPMLLINLELR